ncbi:MAG: hypothetical protein IKN64_02830 [Desulfovibrio sp.]|nr:hypothetical protein [Desulfovibrio sp.]
MFKTFCLPIVLALSLMLPCACSKKGTAQDPYYIDAVELKLKCRELADQMLATMPNQVLDGVIAMPTSFVDQNNTTRSSQLGRLIAESLFYEFNQRGFPTREYRLTGNITVRGARDNLVLIPDAKIRSDQRWASLLLGTYLVDRDATFINARLVRAKDGLVQRTGQLVLVNTPIIKRLGEPDKYVAPPAPSAPKTSRYSTPVKRHPLDNLYTPVQSIGTGTIPIVQQR